MNNYNIKINNIKKSRKIQIKKLTKLLSLLVNTEWDMIAISKSTDDDISYSASKSVAEASKNIQIAISKLILTEYNNLEENNKIKEGKDTIRSMKKVILQK